MDKYSMKGVAPSLMLLDDGEISLMDPLCNITNTGINKIEALNILKADLKEIEGKGVKLDREFSPLSGRQCFLRFTLEDGRVFLFDDIDFRDLCENK